MQRRSVWEWSCAWVGDPQSWERRGALIFNFLVENGLAPTSQVLNIGCGNLSEGAPIIRYLRDDRFVGLDPNGWLVEAALDHMPGLEGKLPKFLWRTDFDASELGRKYTHIVGHSILSHCAHWQLDQLLSNTRKVVDEGAVMLLSFIGDQFNSFSTQWQYPGVSTFRLQTVTAAGYYTGWRVEIMPEYKERMIAECPHDTHDWLRLTAMPSAAEMNDLRLAEEDTQREEKEAIDEREDERLEDARAQDEERILAAGL